MRLSTAAIAVALLGLSLLVAPVATAKEFPVTIRDAAEPRAIELCEHIRNTLSGPDALPGSWTLAQCATTLFARAMRSTEGRIAQDAIKASLRQTLKDAEARSTQDFTDDGKDLVVAPEPTPTL